MQKNGSGCNSDKRLVYQDGDCPVITLSYIPRDPNEISEYSTSLYPIIN